jgi:uncharacterized membrane-anchored protein
MAEEDRSRILTAEKVRQLALGPPKRYRDRMRIQQSSAPYGSRDYVRFKKAADYADDQNDKKARKRLGRAFKKKAEEWIADMPYDAKEVLDKLVSGMRSIKDQLDLLSDIREQVERDVVEAGLPPLEDQDWEEEE